MYYEELFRNAFVYLCAAAFSVPIAKRLGLSSVLGYLIAGIAIGPFGFGLVGEEGQDVMHFAEFGVVLMLFLVGLELQPALLWKLRAPILGLGGLQVGVTAVVIAGLTIAAFNLPWQPSLAIGLTLALSSTAIVLQSLSEKGLMGTRGGRSAFSVLLFQDIAVIPMLAAFPLLAIYTPGEKGHGEDHGENHGEAGHAEDLGHGDGHASEAGDSLTASLEAWIASLPPWGNALLVLVAVAAIIYAGRTVVRLLLRIVGRTGTRETFTAFALLLVIGTSLLMSLLGVSPALGAFLAGVVLATSEYRHELESDIEPFKGLLLGVFFIAVGAGIDFALVAARPVLIAGLVVGLMALKAVVLFLIAGRFDLKGDQRVLFTASLAQAGEFGFVLLGFAMSNGVLLREQGQVLVATVALTMALTPLVMLFEERVLRPRFGTTQEDEKEADEMDEDEPVILIGFGRFGHNVGRFLMAQGIGVTVLDHDSDHIDFLRQIGIPAFYGDAQRPDLLHAAGAEHAKVLIIALESAEKTERIIEACERHFPHLKIFVRGGDREHQYRMVQHKAVTGVVHEQAYSAVELGVQALESLGTRRHTARRSARRFLEHEEDSVRQLAKVHEDRDSYVSALRERLSALEEAFKEDAKSTRQEEVDKAWDTSSLRENPLAGHKSSREDATPPS